MHKDENLKETKAASSPASLHDRAAQRLTDHARKVGARQLAIADLLQTDMPGVPVTTFIIKENTEMKTYDATTIAASRLRISAGIEAFDRIISAKPVAFDFDCDTPESLLDALSRSAIATAASDLAAFSRGPAEIDVDNADAPSTYTIEQLAIEKYEAAPLDPDEQA